jgi:hypothetical protein
MPKQPPNVVTTAIGAILSVNKSRIPVSKKYAACELDHDAEGL